jgi:hypothetical protein
MSQQPNFEERIMMKIAMFAAAAVFALSLPAQAGEHVIATPNAPEAIGPYSQAIQVGNTLYDTDLGLERRQDGGGGEPEG